MKSDSETDLCVDCRVTDFFSNETALFIVNRNLKVLLIVPKIARRFRKTDITMLIIIKQKNDYTERHTAKTDRKKKNGFLEKIDMQTIESTDFSIINILLTFHRCRGHHNSPFGEGGHFHHIAGLIFDFFA